MTKTAQILQTTHGVIHDLISGPAHFAEVFCAYANRYYGRGATALPEGHISQIATGKTLIPRRLIRLYVDPVAPRCPQNLLDDLSDYCKTMLEPNRRLAPMQATLLHSIADLPPADQAEQTADVCLGNPTIDSVAALWCRLLSYAMAMDYATQGESK